IGLGAITRERGDDPIRTDPPNAVVEGVSDVEGPVWPGRDPKRLIELGETGGAAVSTEARRGCAGDAGQHATQAGAGALGPITAMESLADRIIGMMDIERPAAKALGLRIPDAALVDPLLREGELAPGGTRA